VGGGEEAWGRREEGEEGVGGGGGRGVLGGGRHERTLQVQGKMKEN